MVYEVRYTEAYLAWYETLKDANVIARIGVRLKRIQMGNLGDVKTVGSGARKYVSMITFLLTEEAA